MQPRSAATAFSVVALLTLSLIAPRSVAAQGAMYCPSGQPARFNFGIAELHARLGATMGVPLECEHVNPENGDTIQHTSTGLAYYRPSINTPMFTDGQTHWALSNNQVLMWRNPSVEPPRPTTAESSYLDTAYASARRLDTYQTRLVAIQQQASAGQLDAVDVGEVGSLYDAVSEARGVLAQARASERLASYDRMLLGAYDETVAAAELLLRARLTDVPEARAAFVGESANHLAEANRLQGEANNAFSLVLPVVVE